MAKTGKAAQRRAPTAAEQQAIAAAQAAHQAMPVRAQVDREEDEGTTLTLMAPHTDDTGNSALLHETFGSSSDHFVNASMVHLAQLTARGSGVSMQDLNASLALIGAIAPQNELEAVVAAQMAATHDLSMMMLRRAKGAQHMEHIRDFGNLATKLQRTFTTQLKTLADWRRGGEQVVRHVHVYEGGQAVVTDKVMVGAINGNEAFKAHEQGARSAAMLGYDPAGHGVSVSGDQGQEPVQITRGPVKGRRRAKGQP